MNNVGQGHTSQLFIEFCFWHFQSALVDQWVSAGLSSLFLQERKTRVEFSWSFLLRGINILSNGILIYWKGILSRKELTKLKLLTMLFKNADLFRLTLLLSCAMNFHKYPHDEQLCKMSMESCKYYFVLLIESWAHFSIKLIKDTLKLPQAYFFRFCVH